MKNHLSAQITVLGEAFDLMQAAERLSSWPGLLWFDSSSLGPADRSGIPIGRYSFLTADPIDRIRSTFKGTGDHHARSNEENPWQRLQAVVSTLPGCDSSGLPPFAGGWAGLLGYESAGWLEEISISEHPSMSDTDLDFGLYDWTIAVDHVTGRCELIVQPWGNCSTEDRTRAILAILASEAVPLSSRSTSLSNEFDSAFVPTELRAFVPTERPGVNSNFSSDRFRDAVAEIVHGILQGDSFQVNLAQTLSVIDDRHPLAIYRLLRQSNPAPFAGYYDAGNYQVLSSSPEGFLKVRGNQVETRPIKGTVRRTGKEEVDRGLAEKLSVSEKDRAENVMIVDLMRNDLSRVCDDDSIEVASLCKVELYQYVQHLVSVVTGRLRDDQSVVDLLRATFPGGSVTGAPKIEAMQTIARLEPHRRGPYCGSLGYIGPGKHADFNILIRTITHRDGQWQIPVGGGITARSNSKSEETETWTKAEGMLRAFEADAR
jgi:para-aminobenzoate synthetase component I